MEAADYFGAHLVEDRLVEVLGEGIFGELEGGLGHLPVEEAGRFPSGEVLFVDRMSLEFFCEDSLSLGQDIYPFQDQLVLDTGFEAAVKFFADLARETSDFRGLFHR